MTRALETDSIFYILWKQVLIVAVGSSTRQDMQQAFPIVSFYHSEKCYCAEVMAHNSWKPKRVKSCKISNGIKSLTLSQSPLACITIIKQIQRTPLNMHDSRLPLHKMLMSTPQYWFHRSSSSVAGFHAVSNKLCNWGWPWAEWGSKSVLTQHTLRSSERHRKEWAP